jgi:hypothetical protein
MFKEGRRCTLNEPHLYFSSQPLHKMDSVPLQIFQSVLNSPNDVDLDEFLHVQRLCDGASTPPNEPTQAQTCLDEIIITAAASDEIHHKQKRQDDTQRGSELNQSHTQPRRRGIRSSVSSIPEYSVICFPSNPTKPNGIKKKRKDFDEKRRQEVAQVRKSGACFRCKFRRISCGVGAPCQACEKAAGILGRQLCIREKLTKMRFSSGGQFPNASPNPILEWSNSSRSSLY